MGHMLIGGADEVGRGALAGPVTVCVAVLDSEVGIDGLRDSKKMTPRARDACFDLLMVGCEGYGIGHASAEEIDEHGIRRAQEIAAGRALMALDAAADVWFVDGDWNFLPDGLEAEAVVKGDDKIEAIAAASVLAKVTRDRMMVEHAKTYPEYLFEKHKGYGTGAHFDAIRKHGPCALHRMSWEPLCSGFGTPAYHRAVG